MSKEVYVYDGSSGAQLKMWQKKNYFMKAFMYYLSSFELGFSFFKGFFPVGVGPLLGKNSFPLLRMCCAVYLLNGWEAVLVACTTDAPHQY